MPEATESERSPLVYILKSTAMAAFRKHTLASVFQMELPISYPVRKTYSAF